MRSTGNVCLLLSFIALAFVTFGWPNLFSEMVSSSDNGSAPAAPGDLDPSFGNGGKVITDINNLQNDGNAAAVQSDGKIIVGGQVNIATAYLAIVRYNTNGSLDNTFGNGGIVITDNNGLFDNLNALAIQTDGKILAFGNTGGPGPGFLLVRYNNDGTLDSTFGIAGKAITSISTTVNLGYSLVIQTDGKIVGAGQTRDSSNLPAMGVVRFNTDGTLDTTFDLDGKVIVSFGGTDVGWASSVNLQPDGKLVLAGVTDDPTTFRDFAVARLNPDGSLDSGFGSGGKVTTNVDRSDGVSESILQPDGKIVVVGYSNTGSKFALVRYNTNGTLDSSFGNGGKVETVAIAGENFGACLTLQPDGKILVGGSSGVFPNRRFALVRYNTDGSIDTSFALNGRAITPIGNNSLDNPAEILSQPDGKIVLAGDTFNVDTNNKDFALVRYLNDTFTRRAPYDFDGDGKTDISNFRPSLGQWWLNRSTDGLIVHTFGNSADLITPADFTGDGKTDVAIYRPAPGEWFVLRSEDSTFYSFPFGASADIPVPADYDGDTKADAAVFRPGNSTWYIQRSSGGTTIEGFGAAGDRPVVADYDGDGKSDIAIYRPSLGQWWLNRSMAGVIAVTFGNSTDKPVQGDYTGDGKADIAIWRPSNGEWFILRSEDFSFYSFPFGSTGDTPVPGDYDGDGKFDAGVFRSSNSTWYVNRSTAGVLIQGFGASGDVPVPSAFVP